jgi:hypothetical protein
MAAKGGSGRTPRCPRQRSFVEDLASAPLLAAFGSGQIAGLAVGQQHEQLPEVVAVVQLRKAALRGGAAEAVEGTQGDIFLVGGAAGQAGQLAAGVRHQPLEIAFPQRLGGGPLPGLELLDPTGDRTRGRHQPCLRLRSWRLRNACHCTV